MAFDLATAKPVSGGFDLATAKPVDEATFGSLMKDELLRPVRTVRDLAAGAVRGAGSIGATLMRPFESGAENEQRRADMTDSLGRMGADTGSLSFGAGKLSGEIAGTAGAGGVVANGLRAVPAVARVAPNLIQAIRTAGMSSGATGTVGNALTRAAGGAITGGVSAGLVDPEQAGTGAVIGGAAPGVIGAAGWLGSKAGRAVWDMLTPEIQKKAVELAKMTGKDLDEVVSALRTQGPTMVPGSQATVPQILQDRNISQVARTLKSSGQNALGEREALNSIAQLNALERVAPTAGTINEARANLGNATVQAAKAGEAAASRKVRNLFDAIPQDEVQMYLPIDQMQAAKNKFLGRGSFGAGMAPADQALSTARGIGTTSLDAVKAAPVQRQQSLYDAVLSYGKINQNSPSGKMLLGELKDLRASKNGAVVMANNGKSVDKVAEAMHARGFIPDEDPATLIQYLKEAGRDTFASDANAAGQFARRAEAAMGDLPGAETLSKAVPFNEIQNLRSSIGEAAQAAKVAGNRQAAAALSSMKQAIDDKVAAVANGGAQEGEAFSREAVNLWRKGLAAHAAKKAQFNTGPQAAIFRTGADGLPAKEGAEVAPLFWNSGNAQIENLQAFKRLTANDQDLVRLMKSNATTEALQMGAKGPQGALTFDAFNKWMKTHAGAAKELFSEQELATLKAIQDQTRTAAQASSLGQAQGSNTAQNIFSMGALGSPKLQAVANNLPLGLKYIAGPALSGIKGGVEQNRNAILSALLADPAVMAEAIQAYGKRQAPNAIMQLLQSPQAQQLLYRSAPVISVQ